MLLVYVFADEALVRQLIGMELVSSQLETAKLFCEELNGQNVLTRKTACENIVRHTLANKYAISGKMVTFSRLFVNVRLKTRM